MLVRFTSDVTTAGRGFRASFRAIPGGKVIIYQTNT